MRISIEELPKSIVTTHALNYQKIKAKSTNINLEDSNLYEYIQKIGHKMVKTCLLDGGVGLAAPQLGIFKRMFIIQDQHNKELFDLYINPTWKPIDTEKEISPEGCLSVPGKQFKISRYKHIEVDYWCFDPDKNLINIKQNLDGYIARIFQHEYNHLDGISIADLFKKQNSKK